MSGSASPPRPPSGNYVQDGPPPGGYPKIDVRRNLPKNIGPSSTALFVGGTLVMAFGFWRMGRFNVHRRELKQEKREARLAVAPLLQAEEDARYVEEMRTYCEWESKVMEHVPGWRADQGVYKTRSFMPPASSTMPHGE